jgi:hypothetical protein
LNLGDGEMREKLLEHTCLSPCDLDPDEQYCSHAGNERVHKAILESEFFKRYDGTIITENLIDADLLEHLEGPEESTFYREDCRCFDTHGIITLCMIISMC